MALIGLISVAPAQAVRTKSPGPGVEVSYGLKPDGTIVSISTAAKAMASAQSKQALTCTHEPDGKCCWYSGPGQFFRRSICFQNNLGVYWNYLRAQQGFESGSATVKFYNHGASTGTPTSCEASGGWSAEQILTYQAYTTDDGLCAHFTTRRPDRLLRQREHLVDERFAEPSGGMHRHAPAPEQQHLESPRVHARPRPLQQFDEPDGVRHEHLLQKLVQLSRRRR